jgi:hypothetical protein
MFEEGLHRLFDFYQLRTQHHAKVASNIDAPNHKLQDLSWVLVDSSSLVLYKFERLLELIVGVCLAMDMSWN